MSEPSSNSFRQFILPLIGAVVCLFLWPALITFDPGDWPSPHQYPHNAPTANACGPVGAWFAYHLRHWLGDGVFPLLLFATLASLLRLIRGEVGRVWERAFGLALVVGATAASAHLISTPGTGPLPVGHGGVAGVALGELLRDNLDRLGTILVLGASMFVGLLFATQGWVLKLPKAVGRAGRASGQVIIAAHGVATAIPIPKVRFAGPEVTNDEKQALFDEPDDAPDTRERKPSRAAAAAPPPRPEEHVDDDAQTEPPPDTPPARTAMKSTRASDEETGGPPPTAPKRAITPVVNFPRPQEPGSAEPYPRQIENWRLPSLDLLDKPEYGFSAQREAMVRKQAQILERTLEEFRLDARVVEIDTGPVITMFELKLGAGIKVSQIATLSNDIARALKAHAIRVVAPISGKNTVGIEVPNLEKEHVRLRELMEVHGNRAAEMGLPLFLGKDAGGAPLVGDLTRMPHMLIAGTTGSGKSVCLNSIILSMLMTKRPDHVKMILIDPKMVELSQFKEVPHLMCPIVTDMARAEKILEWAVTQMDERYEILAEARVKNIAGYNRLGAEALYERLKPVNEQEKARIATHLPYIVIVIDELADLMMTSAKEVEHHLSRLAQKSRAVGIHIIVATQRPEAKVVTGLIKSNLPCRICFRVASRMDSRIVLDQNGGEVLLGQGDMLFLPPGTHKLMRAQGTYLEEGEIQAVLEDLTSRAQPEFHPELTRMPGSTGDNDAALRDPLFDDAVRIIIESGRGSVSLLQRRLTIGYSRASRLIDQMAEAGIVGAYKGSQAREVMMTMEEWDDLQEQLARDLEAGYEADEDDDEALVSVRPDERDSAVD